jgi:hypothetical protein
MSVSLGISAIFIKQNRKLSRRRHVGLNLAIVSIRQRRFRLHRIRGA